MLEELKVQTDHTMNLLRDDKIAISIAKNHVHHDTTKHVGIDRLFINEKIDDGIIKFDHTPLSHQTLNILTNALYRINFENLRSKLGKIDIYDPS